MSPWRKVASHEVLKQSNAIDLLAWCGCVGSWAPDICSFCVGGGEIEAQQTQASPSLENGSNGIDCAELSVVAPFVTDIDYCDDLQLFAESCCVPPTPPIADTDVKVRNDWFRL